MVKEELEAHRPVLYGGSNKRNEGHQFVLDGYTSNNYFSVNWGWGGYSNGYYLLSGLNPNDQGIGGNTGGFTVGQDAVFGLKKQNPVRNMQTYWPLLKAPKEAKDSIPTKRTSKQAKNLQSLQNTSLILV